MGTETAISVPAREVNLDADVAVPDGMAGLVLFAHGSGSSRHSPRNRLVAAKLREEGFGTVLADLLTPSEERQDAETGALRFDITLLAARVIALIDWAVAGPPAAPERPAPIGLFGASTGAAAALVAAAERPDVVRAVVSRGGRPDLAGGALERVHAPTMLIVGERDPQVRVLNVEAANRLTAPNDTHIVPGATHLFEEPGALPEVAERAAQWFATHLR